MRTVLICILGLVGWPCEFGASCAYTTRRRCYKMGHQPWLSRVP